MAFQLLSVPNFVLPATYAGWLAVDEEQLAAIKVVWTADLLIDVHDSQLFTACPGAFTASQVNGRAVAPLHEVEYLLARFLRASDAIHDMKIGELGISPLKLSAVEAHLVNPGAGAAADRAGSGGGDTCGGKASRRRWRRERSTAVLVLALLRCRGDRRR